MLNAYELIEKLDNYIFDEPNAMDNIEDYGFVKKDIFDGDVLNVSKILPFETFKIKLECTNGVTVVCDLKKDKEYFKLINEDLNTTEEVIEWIFSEDGQNELQKYELKVVVVKQNKDYLGSFLYCHLNAQCEEFFEQIRKSEKIYEAKVVDKNTGGFIVDIAGVKAFLPGGQAAANKIVDFDSFIGKKVPVMVEDFIREGSTFIVSNKKYLKKILPIKIQELDLHTEYTGTVTGKVNFGIFVEFNEIFTGLLHVSEMDMETLNAFEMKNINNGSEIKFYIKEINKNDKIILTKYPISERKQEYTFDDFKEEFENKIVEGEIINYKEELGIFVKFEKEEKQFIGLLYFKDIKNIEDYIIGSKYNFYIAKVLPDVKKIFLKIPR